MARPFGGNSANGVTLTVAAVVPGSAPARPGHGDHDRPGGRAVRSGVLHPGGRIDRAEPDHAGARRQPDARHPARGPALRPHRRRREPQQLGVAGDERQLLILVGQLNRADDPVAVLQRDHVEVGGVLRIVGRDALDHALGGAERQARAGGVGRDDGHDRLARPGRDELADRRAAGQRGGVRARRQRGQLQHAEPDQPPGRGHARRWCRARSS